MHPDGVEIVIDRLLADSAVTAVVGDRLSPGAAVLQTDPLPNALVQSLGAPIEWALGAGNKQTSALEQVEVHIHSLLYPDVSSLARLINTALHGLRVETTGWRSFVTVEDLGRDEQGTLDGGQIVYRRTLIAQIMHAAKN